MKKIFQVFVLFTLITSCQVKQEIKIELTNRSSPDRKGEIVTIDWQSLANNLLEINNFIVLDDQDNEIPYQLLYEGNETPVSLIFPVTIPKNTTLNYLIKKGIPKEFPTRTFGRLVPERKDDFAWENDRVAFRVYGPTLALYEYPSNGIDIWMKKTDSMIVNKLYKEEIENNLSYHVDRGQGLDCYNVGHTLGAGGIAPYSENKIWIADHYTTARLLDSGILRTTFELTYDSVLYQDRLLKEKIIISLDAGSQLNKAQVSYDSGDIDAFLLAGGISLHPEAGIGEISAIQEQGVLAYAEKATSNDGVPAGRDYVGVIFTTPIQTFFQDNNHVAAISEYKKGDLFTYYFGGGWSEWGFKSDKEWFDYVLEYAQKIKSPIEIKLVK
jgi:hypothetical protein